MYTVFCDSSSPLNIFTEKFPATFELGETVCAWHNTLEMVFDYNFSVLQSCPEDVLPVLQEEYSNLQKRKTKQSPETRMKLGEVYMRVIRAMGQL